MAIYLSCIIKNNFYDRNNNKACEKYLNDTISRLSSLYGVGEGIFTKHCFLHEDGHYSYSMKSEIWNVMEIQLLNGMWHVDTTVNYTQAFFKDSYYRLLMQEIAYNLGEKDLWICDNYCTWDSPYLPDVLEETNFEEWYHYISNGINGNKKGKIPEFPTKTYVIDDTERYIIDYPAYHDRIDDYVNRLHKLKKEVKYFDPIALTAIGYYAPMKKDDKLYLVNTINHDVLTNGPIDYYENCLNGAGYVVVKNGKNILVDYSGKILSGPTSGKFTWRWSGTYDIIIENHQLRKSWLRDYRSGLITEISTNK